MEITHESYLLDVNCLQKARTQILCTLLMIRILKTRGFRYICKYEKDLASSQHDMAY